MLIRRNEAKSCGIKSMFKGKFGDSDSCLIIEDIIAYDSNIFETISDLRAEGL